MSSDDNGLLYEHKLTIEEIYNKLTPEQIDYVLKCSLGTPDVNSSYGIRFALYEGVPKSSVKSLHITFDTIGELKSYIRDKKIKTIPFLM